LRVAESFSAFSEQLSSEKINKKQVLRHPLKILELISGPHLELFVCDLKNSMLNLHKMTNVSSDNFN